VSEFSWSTRTTPKLRPDMDNTPRPVEFEPALPGLLTDTVRASLELAQGQMASGRRPLAWKTLRNWSHEDSDHGLAPSATSKSLKITTQHKLNFVS
jgi:hypothetical protein